MTSVITTHEIVFVHLLKSHSTKCISHYLVFKEGIYNLNCLYVATFSVINIIQIKQKKGVSLKLHVLISITSYPSSLSLYHLPSLTKETKICTAERTFLLHYSKIFRMGLSKFVYG